MENNQQFGDPNSGRERDGAAQERGPRQRTGQETGPKTDQQPGRAGGSRVGQKTGLRAAALRRAREAKQARDARRRQHDLGVEGALADYYAAVAYIEDTRARASRRAARILSEAEESVQPVMEEADAALRRLRDLGESRETIRELTQASLARLRAALNGDLNGDLGEGPRRVGSTAAGEGVEASARISDGIGAWHDDRIEAHQVEYIESPDPVDFGEPTGTLSPMGQPIERSAPPQTGGSSGGGSHDVGITPYGPMGEDPLDWGSSGYPAAS